MITASHLIRIYGIKPSRAEVWAPHLAAAMDEFDIATPQRAAAFLAQIGHESGGLRYTKEIWVPTPAQLRYEGRADLGNTHPGDGHRYLGRGPMQTTGYKNYNLAGEALGVDLLAQPQLLERVDYGARAAGWFWQTGAGLNLGKRAREALAKRGMPDVGVNLNSLADADDFETITLCINGGLNGYDDRCKLYGHARKAFGLEAWP